MEAEKICIGGITKAKPRPQKIGSVRWGRLKEDAMEDGYQTEFLTVSIILDRVYRSNILPVSADPQGI